MDVESGLVRKMKGTAYRVLKENSSRKDYRRSFFAATVEELCSRTSFPCPTWIYKAHYQLEDPWFHSPQLSQRDWLLSTTPELFKRRNIFVGGSILDNKYELQQTSHARPRWSIWSDQELQNLAASDEVSSPTL